MQSMTIYKFLNIISMSGSYAIEVEVILYETIEQGN